MKSDVWFNLCKWLFKLMFFTGHAHCLPSNIWNSITYGCLGTEGFFFFTRREMFHCGPYQFTFIPAVASVFSLCWADVWFLSSKIPRIESSVWRLKIKRHKQRTCDKDYRRLTVVTMWKERQTNCSEKLSLSASRKRFQRGICVCAESNEGQYKACSIACDFIKDVRIVN